MFPIRLKMRSTRNLEYRCFFCLHVKTATILLGIWHMTLHIVALTVLALLMRNHHIIVQKHNEFQQNDFLPTPLSKVKEDSNPYYLPTTQDGGPVYSSDIDMGALITVCTLSICLLMVYGTVKGKSTYILPFLCLQMFDFAISALTATGYFCYLRSVQRLIAEQWQNLPYRNELMQMNAQYLSLLVFVIFIFCMLWKAYCINVVWRCHRYLNAKHEDRQNTIHYILPGEGGDRSEPDYPGLFREHEGVFSSMKQTPPPSYQDIMDDPPPYPASLLHEPIQNPSVRVGIFTSVSDRDQERNIDEVDSNTSRVETNIEVTTNLNERENDVPTSRVSVETNVTSEVANSSVQRE